MSKSHRAVPRARASPQGIEHRRLDRLRPGRTGRRIASRQALGGCIGLALAFAGPAVTKQAAAQQATAPMPSPLGSYHPPLLVLVQPASGAAIPQDRPIVLFRFVAGDSIDPVDTRSLGVAVDGKDRSTLFQSARDMAWGPLAADAELSSLSVGGHALNARICSIRGACADVSATVTVVASAVAPASAGANRKPTLIQVLLGAVKKLLLP
jgi:hypothetical protein